MFEDLREFLILLEQKGLLARVKEEVDPEWEINGITNKLLLEGGPAVLFEKVRKCKVPLVAGVLGTKERIALALGTTPDKIRDEWISKLDNPIKTEIVKTGPCKENILLGDKADITMFPQVKWHEKDAGPYIGTLGIQITKDPETGVQNAGIYRMMNRTRNETTVWLAPGQHGWIHYTKWEAMGKPMPMAVVFSTDPFVMMTAAAKLLHPPDEFEVAGGLMGKPVKMVRCETIDIEVPATSEIVLEGEVPPKIRATCGPFGEWTGHVSIPLQTPIYKVKAITHRNKPIFWGTREGKWPNESALICLGALDYLFYKRMKQRFEVKDARIPLESAGHMALVSIKKEYEGQPQEIMQAIWGSIEFGSYSKHVYVFDEDVNIQDPSDVFWALSTRVEPTRSVVIFPRTPYYEADVSQPPSKRFIGGKIGIDATLPVLEYKAEGAEIPEQCGDPNTKKKVEKNWEKYGIKKYKSSS